MLTLARADNGIRPAAMEPVSTFRPCGTECALAFEPVAFEAGKPLEYHIWRRMCAVTGDRGAAAAAHFHSVGQRREVRHAGGHHRPDAGKNWIGRRGSRRPTPGSPFLRSSWRTCFERFYRADPSRGETCRLRAGALAIADRPSPGSTKARLRAESDAASTRFIFTLPLGRGTPAGKADEGTKKQP